MPDLHVLSIGVSKYPNLPEDWQLSYAHSDAKAIVETFLENPDKLFGQVHSVLLENEKASPNSILEALERLQHLTENDIHLIFVAGHGVMARNDMSSYFCAPAPISKTPKQKV